MLLQIADREIETIDGPVVVVQTLDKDEIPEIGIGLVPETDLDLRVEKTGVGLHLEVEIITIEVISVAVPFEISGVVVAIGDAIVQCEMIEIIETGIFEGIAIRGIDTTIVPIGIDDVSPGKEETQGVCHANPEEWTIVSIEATVDREKDPGNVQRKEVSVGIYREIRAYAIISEKIQENHLEVAQSIEIMDDFAHHLRLNQFQR